MSFPVTLAELKVRFPSTGVGDDDLQRYLDAAEEDILQAIGPTIDGYTVTSVTERFTPHGDKILLSRRAQAIVEIEEYAHRETPTTLAEDDYELQPSGDMLLRRPGGTNGCSYWRPVVSVEYEPYSDIAKRETTQIALVQLDINHNPGISQEQIGAWSQRSDSSSVWNYQTERQAILDTLRHDSGGWVF